MFTICHTANRMTRPNTALVALKTIDIDALPASTYLRQGQLLHPVGPLPFSPATLWRRVKQDFPAPVKLGVRVSAWRVGDVRQWLAAQAVGVC